MVGHRCKECRLAAGVDPPDVAPVGIIIPIRRSNNEITAKNTGPIDVNATPQQMGRTLIQDHPRESGIAICANSTAVGLNPGHFVGMAIADEEFTDSESP